MAKRMGQPSIFEDKSGGDRVQGNISGRGSVAFEAARRRLAKLAGWEYERVSDGDTIEYLARGNNPTRIYLEIKSRKKKAATN